MIYVTGDVHGGIDIRKLSTDGFPDGRRLTKDDYVVVCGDFGLVWDGSNEEKYWTKWLCGKPWTTLFIDGNHENFDRLFALPEVPMFNGNVRKAADSIYYLQRGHVYEIQGKTFLALGSAASHDKECRKEGVSWWPQEIPAKNELKTATDSLTDHGFKVDYVLTHCAPSRIQEKGWPGYETDSMTDFLQSLADNVLFGSWFFGHYHEDRIIANKFVCTYQNVIRIE